MLQNLEGQDISLVRDAFIIKRWLVRLTFDNNYFNVMYQGIPVGGYAEMAVYTGPMDTFYDYRLGYLEYSSVRFENDILAIQNFQGNIQ